MGMSSDLRRRAGAALGTVFAIAVVGFFAWHTLQGSRGLIALGAIREQIALAEAELRRLEAERDRIEARVSGLRADRLDADALDERARLMLNLVGRDEIVILYGPGGRLY
jgi:cell division protein FtsB